MKKNKTIAYALAATLLVGGTFVGTKALFTDKADATTDLVLTTGKVDVEVNEGKWSRNGVESDNGEFGLVIPGDIFTKKITISNKSTVDAKLTTDMEFIKDTDAGSKLKKALDDKFVSMNETIKLQDGTTLEGSDFENAVEGLASNESLTVTIEAKVGAHLNTSGLTQEEMNKIDNEYQEYKLDFENGQMQYVINAEQANVPNK